MYCSIGFITMPQPPSFAVKAFARRASGIRSKSDSVTVSMTPSAQRRRDATGMRIAALVPCASIVISNGMPSYSFWSLAASVTGRGRRDHPVHAGAWNGPSNFMPNQLPNSAESASARQMRFRGARNRTYFSCVGPACAALAVTQFQSSLID